MANRLPIKAAKDVAEQYDCRQVILLAWDGRLTHIVTFGETVEDCAQAAAGGNILKQKWGWPECNDQPSRVKQLEAQVEELKAALAALPESRKVDWRGYCEKIVAFDDDPDADMGSLLAEVAERLREGE